MQETLKFVRFEEAHKNQNDKWIPNKAWDGNDKDYRIDKDDVEFLKGHLNVPLLVDFTEQVNGKFTNRTVTSMGVPEVPKPHANGGGWKRDPAESSLILRQVALKAAVEHVGDKWSPTTVLAVAEIFNDWLHDRPSKTPEQAAAKEALATGGSYAEALNKQKPHATMTLKPGQNLKDAVAEVLANHDPLADDEVPPPWVDQTPPTRETLRASRGAVR